MALSSVAGSWGGVPPVAETMTAADVAAAGPDLDIPWGFPDEVGEIDRELRLQILREEMKGAVPGSKVHIIDATGRTSLATLLTAGPDGVNVMNCLSRDAVPGPNGQQQCRTSHLPYQSFDIESLRRFQVLSPPSPDFVAPEVGGGGGDVTVAAVVFHSGARQTWGVTNDDEEPAGTANVTEE
jgi:hypothetical protein